jgi:glycerol-3-phosphate acyltransferase PlsX
MGGDVGPLVTVPAAIQSLKDNPFLSVILVGDSYRIMPLLKQYPLGLRSRVQVEHVVHQVPMDAKPSSALRSKNPTSMRVCIEMVEQGRASACISAGNTGALMALGAHVLKRLPGVQRPAICTSMPAMNGHCYMLDLGANVDCSAEVLLQHALMGSCLAQGLDHLSRPRVALLNVGEEGNKGNAQVKEAAALLLKDDTINFVGYVEGGDLFTGNADVVVCDGFVGNIALKASEGVAKLISHNIRMSFSSSFLGKVLGAIFFPVLSRIYHRIDPRRFNGASFLGLGGVVVKSHGNADVLAFKCAVNHAVGLVKEGVIDNMNAKFVSRAH